MQKAGFLMGRLFFGYLAIKIFYMHSPPSDDSRRATVNYQENNVLLEVVNCPREHIQGKVVNECPNYLKCVNNT